LLVGDLGLVLALVTAGYIVGVWTGALVFRQRQSPYEDGAPATVSSREVIVIGARQPREGSQ
jgi:hypothetical protein